VRGHDQTSRRVRRRAWSGLILAAIAAAAPTAAPARAQEVPDAEPAPPRARDPIDLAAQRVHTWKADGARWVHLAGRVAVLQGVEGVRADEALVRIVATPSPAGTTYRLDVYAESAPRRTVRATFETDQAVSLSPYQRSGLVPSDAPPVRLPILGRSGLLTPPNPPAPQTYQVSRPSIRPPQQPVAFEPTPTAADPAQAPVAPAQPDLVTLPSDRPPNTSVVSGPVVELPLEGGPPDPAPSPAPAPSGTTVRRAAGDPGSGPAKVDPAVRPAQFSGPIEATDDPDRMGGSDLPPPVEPPDFDQAPTVPRVSPPAEVEAEPLPGEDGRPAPPLRAGPRQRAADQPPATPVLPNTTRVTKIFPRSGGPDFLLERLGVANGTETWVVRGGVRIVTEAPQYGLIDIRADSAVIWRRVDENGRSFAVGPNGEQIDDERQPLEFYLEGNVVVLQDERKVAGNGDQKTYRAKQAYYDVLSERFIAIDGEVDMFAPGLITPARVTAPRIEQYRPFRVGPDGRGEFGLPEIRADRSMGTGSRFPNPSYRFNSRSVDLYRIPVVERDPNSGRAADPETDPDAREDLTWRIDARQNVFWMGYVPVFYWPRFAADAEDLEPALRGFTFRTNNYFGQQALADFNGFRLINVQKPKYIDMWNVDLDYLSYRTKGFPALGSEIGWFGSDLLNDLRDPYGRVRGKTPTFTQDYFGYFDIWGLRDFGRDILGSGPAIITNNIRAGQLGIQRGGGGPLGSVPAFQDFRGRLNFRHMQRLIPDDDEHLYEDFRAQLEAGYYSDRYFLEEYYKRLFDVGMDQETLAYLIRQRQNTAWSVWTEANTMSWQTETQWLPRLDYYRLGDSLLGDRLTYFQHTGGDYANVQTASEVNNAHIFAFLPFDPISNTSGVFKSSRFYTNHELDAPLNFGNILRVVPYLQGQAVGWDRQINNAAMGRVWGAAGARAEVMAWKVYPWAESELMNVHGFNHKINLEADFRAAYANQNLNAIGVQDDLDDNTYEAVRRYLALTNYAGGLLPGQYDPRHLILRRTLSPITGTTDIQGSMTTLHVGLHQRLQTKRGPEGKRRVVDYITLDLDTTYFPDASRDNFGKPFGQNMYNFNWFLGDRTSIQSYGWFEFWTLGGQPIYNTNINRHNDPFGLNVITSGVNLMRPPRGQVFIGYSIIDSGPLNTSAMNVSASYWLSPKWYGTYASMYDFGNAILLSAMFSLTRVGADYLTSVGLTVDPQRSINGVPSMMFAIQISPRLSPNVKLGNGVGLNNFDARFAPTQ
jgi:hypothetical protein